MSLPTGCLTPENTAEFWRQAWAEGHTGWKTFERNTAVFTKNIRALEETLEAKATNNNNNGQISIFRDHQGAFVPLCGDTYAVRFLADGFADCGIDSALKQVSDTAEDREKELFAVLGKDCRGTPNHHFVMGVDIAPESIEKSMKQNFPELTFVDLAPILHKGSQDNTASHGKENPITAHFFARAVCPREYGAYVNGASPSTVPFVDIHLFVGDYFAVTEWWAKQASSPSFGGQGTAIAFPYFDTVYDRASMMAMHPSLRQRYVDGIKMVIGCGPTTPTPTATSYSSVVRDKAKKNSPRIFLELAHREEGKRDVGPPFHIDPFTVAPLLGEEAAASDSSSTFYGSAFRIVPLNYDDPDNGNESFHMAKFGLFLI